MLRILFLAVADAVPAGQCCRCYDTEAPCWPSTDVWDALNTTVEGRLVKDTTRFDRCVGDSVDYNECVALLTEMADNYVSADENLLQSTGNFRLFEGVSDTPPLYIRAETAGDIVAALNFTQEHSLRLVVKNTGHDWYGRQIANPALQIFTHFMKEVTWHDTWTTCDGSVLQDAVTVQAGVQWLDVVPELMERGRYTTYGTSMSVGTTGGFLQGGGFPAISGQYGSAADNVREMTVVTANGALITINACNEHQDLFWAFRGGGGGTFGVVVDATYETYESWDNLATMIGVIRFGTAAASVVRRKFLEHYGSLEQARWSFVYTHFYVDRIFVLGFVNTLTDVEAQESWAPFYEWCDVVGCYMQEYTATGDTELSELPLYVHAPHPVTGKALLSPELYADPDLRVGAFDVAPTFWKGETGFQVSKDQWLDGTLADFLNGVAFAEGGVSFLSMDLTKALKDKFSFSNATSLNPTVYEAYGHVYTMPVTPDTGYWSRAFAWYMWPSSMLDCDGPHDASFDTEQCLFSYPDMATQDCLAAKAAEAFPNAGSYMNENDPLHPEWQNSQWGIQYDALWAIKQMYDPMDLFTCHHCVGSEALVHVETSRGFCMAEEVDSCDWYTGADLGDVLLSDPPPTFQHRSWDLNTLECPTFTPDEYAFTSTEYYYEMMSMSPGSGGIVSIISLASLLLF